MSTKRLRLFAGPNGSGKSTIIETLKKTKLDFGVYLNADDLEKTLEKEHSIDLATYKLYDVTENEFHSFISNHSIMGKASEEGFNISLTYNDNRIINNNHSTNSYEASLIVSFIIDRLLEKGMKLSFESVMSHPSKLNILKKAREKGYKNYLYFVCTQDTQINLSRVKSRVKAGGHSVNPDKIESRYARTLELLPEAVTLTYRTFIWDNSGDTAEFIMEIEPEKEENNTKIQTKSIPTWIQTYLIDKLS